MAFVLGAAIGLERQWRHRLAGLRTNALVSMGAALFILLAEKIVGDNSSDARIAAQIVSGIGFLGAGVIMKEGFNVSGLNTAATIWCSGAIGSLCGMGYWYESVVGTFFVLMAHFILRPIGETINKKYAPKKDIDEVSYLFKITCSASTENVVRSLLLRAVDKSSSLKIAGLQVEDDLDMKRTHIMADIRSAQKHDLAIEELVSILSLEETVFAVHWEIKENKKP